MAHTVHGHHIPGTAGEGAIPRKPISKCGGVQVCSVCNTEALAYTGNALEDQTRKAVELGRKCQDLEINMLWEEYKDALKEWSDFQRDSDRDLLPKLILLYWQERDRGLTGN